MRRNRNPVRAFSFVEVMAAMVILSISLVVLMESQARSMDLVARSRSIDIGVTLASEKMSELTRETDEKGLTALKDDASGEFDQEKYPTYKWNYRVLDVPTPDFAAMIGMANGGDEEKGAKKEGAQNADLFAGPLQQIGKIWGQSLKELHLEVTWTNGAREGSYELVTHLVSKDVMGQIQGLLGALTGGAGGGGGQPGGGNPP